MSVSFEKVCKQNIFLRFIYFIKSRYLSDGWEIIDNLTHAYNYTDTINIPITVKYEYINNDKKSFSAVQSIQEIIRDYIESSFGNHERKIIIEHVFPRDERFLIIILHIIKVGAMEQNA